MMSSSFEPINKNIIFSYERQLCSKMNIDEDIMNQDCSNIFISLLNEFSSTNINLLYFLNKLLPNISNFNDICIKYFISLTEAFKYYMNINKSNINNIKNSNCSLILILNSISKFIKIFSSNQEKYNEKHKNILKQFPQFLQLFFKLFQQKYDEMILLYDNEKKVIESFLIVCLTFVEYYPTLMRSYQNSIEKFIKIIFYNFIVKNYIETNTLNIAIALYVNLYKLSPNMVIRYQDYLLIIVNNIKYYLEYFRPKTIEEEENNNDKKDEIILEQKNNLFHLGEDKDKTEEIDNKNILQADKLMEILFKLLHNIFKFMACNIYFEIDFNNIFCLFNDILSLYESLDNNKLKSSLSMIIFNGLSKTNYKFFLINTNEKAINILIYLISNFSQYIYCYNVFFSKYINKILLNQNFFKNSIYTFNLHIKILSFFGTIITYFNYILPEEIELIIYKHIYNNFPLLYLKYLQQNDKTILKVDEVYFKASSIKNKIYSYDSDNIGENFSPNDTHILLLEYFKIIYNYCSVAKHIDQLNYKNILGGMIDLTILPPFAKFIFNIHNDIKKIIIEIIEICIKRNLIYINKQKLFYFLNNFYLFDGELKFKAEIIINLLMIKDVELLNDNYEENNNYYGGVPNNIFGQVFDFNKKIKEYLSESFKKLEQINSINTEEKNENKNIEEINNELDNSINNEMLNKKRKIKNDEEEEDNIRNNENDNENLERKGNKSKKKKYKKIIKKDNIKIEQENKEDKKEEKNENNNENKNENKNEDDIQIEEDIDIPDIV